MVDRAVKKEWRNLNRPEAAKAFLDEYEALCKKHGIKIGFWTRYCDDAGFQLEGLDAGESATASSDGLMLSGGEVSPYVYTYCEVPS